jgi:hypothetical protein
MFGNVGVTNCDLEARLHRGAVSLIICAWHSLKSGPKIGA